MMSCIAHNMINCVGISREAILLTQLYNNCSETHHEFEY